ncbi:MAG: hypothetical protein AVDCRST_MAG65-1250, partial [uncultured Solirubrobacteraceae bacterium]
DDDEPGHAVPRGAVAVDAAHADRPGRAGHSRGARPRARGPRHADRPGRSRAQRPAAARTGGPRRAVSGSRGPGDGL